MGDPPKKAARVFDFQAMMEQARMGAQERTKVDWDAEIERAKEENETRILELHQKAKEAEKKMQTTGGQPLSNDDDDNDDDFGPSLDLATTSTKNDESDDDEEPSEVSRMN